MGDLVDAALAETVGDPSPITHVEPWQIFRRDLLILQ